MRPLALVVVFLLAGCAGVPQAQLAGSACAAGEASYACQVERYHNISDP